MENVRFLQGVKQYFCTKGTEEKRAIHGQSEKRGEEIAPRRSKREKKVSYFKQLCCVFT